MLYTQSNHPDLSPMCHPLINAYYRVQEWKSVQPLNSWSPYQHTWSMYYCDALEHLLQMSSHYNQEACFEISKKHASHIPKKHASEYQQSYVLGEDDYSGPYTDDLHTCHCGHREQDHHDITGCRKYVLAQPFISWDIAEECPCLVYRPKAVSNV